MARWALCTAGLLLLTAVVVGALLGDRVHADAAPLYARWWPHVGPGTPLALLAALAVIRWGPQTASTLTWRPLLAAGWLYGIAWTVALVLIDVGLRSPGSTLGGPDGYLDSASQVQSLGGLLPSFTDRILAGSADSWPTHVAGHPPGALLVFTSLDRIGLGGGLPAAALCVLVGTSAIPAVLVALRALGTEAAARRAAPFVAVSPLALWIGVSADALFLGVTAWGLALLAVATRGRGTPLLTSASVGAGLLLAAGAYLSYGLVLMAVPVVAILACRRTLRPLPGLGVGAVAVVAVFQLGGFGWWQGFWLTVERYGQGYAAVRPYGYWVWASLAALAVAVGPAVVAGAGRLAAQLPVRGSLAAASSPGGLGAVQWLCAGALGAMALASLSGLSKGEVERIWLPFAFWMLPLAALLHYPAYRHWLAAQSGCTLVVAHLLLTGW